MSEVLLITRLRTLNKGNQALSAAWLQMVRRAFPSTPVRLLERRPRYLLQYTLRDIARERDPFSAFDRIAERLARLAPGPGYIGAPPPHVEIRLDETIQPPQRFVALRRRLNLRGRAAALGLYREEYLRRLSACQRARLVVVNPAGEFFPREPLAAFYHLLDTHVAQKLGQPTAIVNHTMDITDPTLRTIIPHVYKTLALVGFRDDKSINAFRHMGGDDSNVLVTPDLALTTEVGRRVEFRSRRVAVAINVPEAGAGRYLPRWREAIESLQRAGFAVDLVSNELPADLPFYEPLMRDMPHLKLVGAGLDHDRYAELLGTYEVVVSSRMHTGVLAMCAGVPVVAVEGSSFKITGLYEELALSRPVIRPVGDGWPGQVVRQAEAVAAQREVASREVSNALGPVRERIVSTLVPRLAAVARAP